MDFSKKLYTVYQMVLDFDLAGLRPRPGFSNVARPFTLCLLCSRAFPKFQRGPGEQPALVSEMVVHALRDIGVDTIWVFLRCAAAWAAPRFTFIFGSLK